VNIIDYTALPYVIKNGNFHWLKMGQAKPENQIICRHQQKRCHDPDMDCNVHVSTSGFSQVPIKTDEKHAANITTIAAQFV